MRCFEVLYVTIWFQVFMFIANNLHTMKYLLVLKVIMSFEIYQSNTNGFQIDLFDPLMGNYQSFRTVIPQPGVVWCFK